VVNIFAEEGTYYLPAGATGSFVTGNCDFSGFDLITDGPSPDYASITLTGTSITTWPSRTGHYTVLAASSDASGLLTTITVSPDGGGGGLFPVDGGLEASFLCYTSISGHTSVCGGFTSYVDTSPIVSNTANTVTFLNAYAGSLVPANGDTFVFDVEASIFTTTSLDGNTNTAAVFTRGSGAGVVNVNNVSLLDSTGDSTGFLVYNSQISASSVSGLTTNGLSFYTIGASSTGGYLTFYGVSAPAVNPQGGTQLFSADVGGYISVYIAYIETSHGIPISANHNSNIDVYEFYIKGIPISSSFTQVSAQHHSTINLVTGYIYGGYGSVGPVQAYDGSTISAASLSGQIPGGTLPFFAEGNSELVLTSDVTLNSALPDGGNGSAFWPDGGDSLLDGGGFWLGLGATTSTYSRTRFLGAGVIADPLTFSLSTSPYAPAR
jgi:hypothetical protein